MQVGNGSAAFRGGGEHGDGSGVVGGENLELSAGDGGGIWIDDSEFEIDGQRRYSKKHRETRARKTRMQSSLTRERDCCGGGSHRSPGFASEDVCPILQAAFPGTFPVTGCDFLAYSCAAARDLHPLPNFRLNERKCANLDLERAQKACLEFTRGCGGMSNRRAREYEGNF